MSPYGHTDRQTEGLITIIIMRSLKRNNYVNVIMYRVFKQNKKNTAEAGTDRQDEIRVAIIERAIMVTWYRHQLKVLFAQQTRNKLL